MVFIAFAFGVWLGSLRGKRAGIPPGSVMDLTVWILVSSLAGARAAYVIAHLDEFRGRWLDAVSPFQSDGTIGIAGLVILGGVIVAVPVAALWLKHRRIPFLKMIDVLTPSLAFGIALGRVGCFLNGCCFGNPTDLPWGALFPPECYAGSVYPGVHIHPTQVYSILYNAAIGGLLLYLSPRRRFEGQLFFTWLALYGLARFWVETLRYYPPNLIPLHIGGLQITGSMLISLAMFAAGVVLLARGFKQAERQSG